MSAFLRWVAFVFKIKAWSSEEAAMTVKEMEKAKCRTTMEASEKAQRMGNKKENEGSKKVITRERTLCA